MNEERLANAKNTAGTLLFLGSIVSIAIGIKTGTSKELADLVGEHGQLAFLVGGGALWSGGCLLMESANSELIAIDESKADSNHYISE